MEKSINEYNQQINYDTHASWIILVYTTVAASMGWFLESSCEGTWLQNVTEIPTGLDSEECFTWFPSLLDMLSLFKKYFD